jgi:hypothetical protein
MCVGAALNDGNIGDSDRSPCWTDEDAHFQTLVEHDPPLDEEMWQRAWDSWKRQLTPVISNTHLRALIEAKRQSLVAFEAQTTTSIVDHHTEDITTFQTEVSSWLDHYYIQSIERTSRGITEQAALYKHGYLGVRRNSNGLETPLTIREEFRPEELFSPRAPLELAMLSNTAIFPVTLFAYDLVACLDHAGAVILENTTFVNGTDCIVLLVGVPAGIRIFMSVDHHYAVVRYEEFAYLRDNNDRIVNRALQHVRTAHEFVNQGNDVWLPLHVVIDVYDPRSGTIEGTRPARTEDTRFISMRFFDNVKDRSFVEMTGDSNLIHDKARHLKYKLGEPPTIEGSLNNEIIALQDSREVRSRAESYQGVADTRGWRPLIDILSASLCVLVCCLCRSWWSTRIL